MIQHENKTREIITKKCLDHWYTEMLTSKTRQNDSGTEGEATFDIFLKIR